MAKIKLNKLVESASGRVGKNMMFKQVGGTTLFTSIPEFTDEATAKQISHRERFKRAARYAKLSLADAAMKAAYAQSVKGKDFQNAYTAAIADFMIPPKVNCVDVTGYSGNIGEIITVEALDGFKIASVMITITQGNNTPVETGAAIQSAASGNWKYITTAINSMVAGSKINIVLTDKPGNVTFFEQVL